VSTGDSYIDARNAVQHSRQLMGVTSHSNGSLSSVMATSLSNSMPAGYSHMYGTPPPQSTPQPSHSQHTHSPTSYHHHHQAHYHQDEPGVGIYFPLSQVSDGLASNPSSVSPKLECPSPSSAAADQRQQVLAPELDMDSPHIVRKRAHSTSNNNNNNNNKKLKLDSVGERPTVVSLSS